MRAAIPPQMPLMRALFEAFDVDKSGAVDEGEFISSMLACGIRSYGVSKEQLLALFHKHAELEPNPEDCTHGAVAVLTVEQLEAVLHSCGLMKHVGMLLTRFQGLNATAFNFPSARAPERDQARRDVSKAPARATQDLGVSTRPSLADRRHNVIHQMSTTRSSFLD